MVELVNKIGGLVKRRRSALAKSGDWFPRYEIIAERVSGQEKKFLTCSAPWSFQSPPRFFPTRSFRFG
ncbi:hypothetical protein Rcae01_02245 [Novipirellula caenicola]|uniref:Uncharacterized protein n=1 Tax=Novipirellula caenicola TaxID=1536901 RepID=A0ABP9VNM5_9BACT